MDAGVCPAGQMWCPGCTPGTGSCGTACPGLVCAPLDAGCADGACSQDAVQSQDVPPACSQIRTQAACDQRGDCHSVNFNQKSCGCSTPGCCASFDHCESGGTVACNGLVNCTYTTPYCEAPFVVQYQGKCFYGCVLASKCALSATCPLTAPSSGASCGGAALSCFYQDCAGAGRTQANCQNGVWNVQTVACADVVCSGGGIYSGSGAICGPGQICVRTTGGGGAYIITPSCIDNTCSPSPVSLSCIQGLYGSCFVTSEKTINCTQPSLCGPSQGGCQ